jgi:hypothetical protein
VRHRPLRSRRSVVLLRAGLVLLALCSLTACNDPRAAAGNADHDGGIGTGGNADAGPTTDSIGVDIQTSDSGGLDTPDTAKPLDIAPVDVPCSGAMPKPDGSCCPGSQAFDPASGACATFGPPGCTGSAEDCVPRWCVDWLDASAKSCDPKALGCAPVGRACTASEVAAGAGCPAGQVPEGKGCSPAGSLVTLPSSVTWSGDEIVLGTGATAVTAQDLDPGQAPAPLPAVAPPLACPGAIAGCAVPCPVGSAADSQGQCLPIQGVAWVCPPGFVQGQAPAAACVPDPADCGTDVFGGVQDAAGTVFVDATAIAKPTGQRLAPFPTVAAALVGLPDGGTVVVAAGTYPTAIDTQKKLTILGRCAAKVTLQGLVGLSVVHGFGLGQMQIHGVTVSGGREPLRFDGPAQATVSRVQVTGGARFGLYATGNAVVTAKDLFVHDIQPSASDNTVGQGLHASDGAHLTIENARLSSNRDRGLYADGAGTKVTAIGLVVDGTLAEVKAGEYGDGLSASGGAQVTVQGGRFTGNRTAGILAISPGTAVTATDVLIETTQPQDSDSKGGRGVTVLAGAAMDLRQVRVIGNHSTGVLADGAGTLLHATALHVSATLGDQNGSAGQGVDLEGGAHALLDLVDLTGNRSEGLLALDPGTEVTATHLLVEATLPRQKDKGSGVGVSINTSALAQLQDARISANHFTGLYASGSATHVTMVGTIDANLGTATDAKGGYGVLAEAGAHIAIQGRITANHTIGLLAVGTGTRIDAGPDLIVDAMLPQTSDGWGGRAAGVEEAGTLSMHGAKLWNNRDVSVYVQGPGSTLELVDVAIVKTQPRPDGHGGHGLNVLGGAQAQLQQVRVVGSSEVGVIVDGAGTQVAAQGLTVAGTLARIDGKYGRGLQVGAGAQLVVAGPQLRVLGNADAGVVVDGAGSVLASQAGQAASVASGGNGGRGLVVQSGARVQLEDVQLWQDGKAGLYVGGTGSKVVLATLLGLQTEGRGVEVQRGATLTVKTGAVLALNREIALMVAGKDTSATLTGLRIAQTAPAKDHLLGHGVQAQDTATVTLLGPRITGQREAGVLARGGKAVLAGPWIASGKPLDVAGAGLGAAVIAAAAGQVTVRGGRLDALWGAGVLVDNAAAILEATIVRDVQPAVTGQPADGVMAHGAASLSIVQSWLTQAVRAGLLVDGKGATLQGTRVDASGLGVAVQHGGLVTELAGQVTGNGQDHVIGGNLPLSGPPAAAAGLDDVPLASP